ncbi:MAG: hypothetical protein CM1200mP1_08050 [Candidatus Neomarinimicrobiota bacterium]|nr:MAG: hypothetical protein CM1200mP1_08050 [Candidatus Neomarinimicrobiota bacterium]
MILMGYAKSNHQDLDPRVIYIQGGKKPYGMVQGLGRSLMVPYF